MMQIIQDFKIHEACFCLFITQYLHWDNFSAGRTRQVVRHMNEINPNNKIITFSLNDLKINDVLITPCEEEELVYLNFNLTPESISLLIHDSELKMLFSEAGILNKYVVVYIYFKNIQYITHSSVDSNSFSIDIFFNNCTTMCNSEMECKMSHCTENENKIRFLVAEEEFHKFLDILKAVGIYSKINETERYLRGISADLQNNVIATVTDTERDCFLQNIFIRKPKEMTPINPPKRRRISSCSNVSANSIRRRRLFNDSYIDDLPIQPEPESFALKFSNSQPITSANVSLEIVNTTVEDIEDQLISSSPKTPSSNYEESFCDSIKSSTPKTPSRRRTQLELLESAYKISIHNTCSGQKTTEKKRKIKKGDFDSSADLEGFAGNDINFSNAHNDKFQSRIVQFGSQDYPTSSTTNFSNAHRDKFQSRIVQFRSQDYPTSSTTNSKQVTELQPDANLNASSSASLNLERVPSDSKLTCAKHFHFYSSSDSDSLSTENMNFETYSQRLEQLYAQVDKIREAARQHNQEEPFTECQRTALINYLHSLHEFWSKENKRYKKEFDDKFKDFLSKF